MKRHELIAYASSFTAFLINEIKEELNNIDSVILYGSVVHGEATKESDIDFFVDTKKANLEAPIKKILEKFYRSREATIFKTAGIENEISLKVGQLIKWKGLYRSIISSSIVLYSKFEAGKKPAGTKHSIIFYWESIGKNRGSFLNKLYGVRIKNKFYKGAIEKWGGERIGKSCIILPIKYREEAVKLLKMHKVKAKSKEVFLG